jgi:galactitol-specific phosphotransferase system IIC component
MRKQFMKLLDVKSIVTLALTAVFAVLSVRGDLTAEQFLTVFTVVISFYFGTQYQKSKEAKTDAKHSDD